MSELQEFIKKLMQELKEKEQGIEASESYDEEASLTRIEIEDIYNDFLQEKELLEASNNPLSLDDKIQILEELLKTTQEEQRKHLKVLNDKIKAIQIRIKDE